MIGTGPPRGTGARMRSGGAGGEVSMGGSAMGEGSMGGGSMRVGSMGRGGSRVESALRKRACSCGVGSEGREGWGATVLLVTLGCREGGGRVMAPEEGEGMRLG